MTKPKVKAPARKGQTDAPRRGRPALERERTVKAGVVLTARQLGVLDRLALDIRDASGGRAFTRSDVLRGIVAGVLESGLKLSEATSETEIAEFISARLRR